MSLIIIALSVGGLCFLFGIYWLFVVNQADSYKVWDYCQHELNIRHYDLLVHGTLETYKDFKVRLKAKLIKHYHLTELVAQGCVDNILDKNYFIRSIGNTQAKPNNPQGFGDGYDETDYESFNQNK